MILTGLFPSINWHRAMIIRQMDIPTAIREFLKELYAAWSADKPARLAAALAYYGMFSFAPMLYIVLTVAGIFIDTLAMADQLFAGLVDTLGYETAQFIQDMVLSASQRTSGATTLGSLISLGALLYAATGLFAHLKYSLNIIWQAPPSNRGGIMEFVTTRLLAFVMVLGVGLLLVLATTISFFASILTSFFDFGGELLAGNVISFVGLAALSFALIYKLVPDAPVAWRDVWPGALITATAFAVGRWGLGFYLSRSSVGSAFEAAGALAIVLIAIYYAAQIFLFGAIFTKVYARRFGSRRTRAGGQ
jgi:membrane protein